MPLSREDEIRGKQVKGCFAFDYIPAGVYNDPYGGEIETIRNYVWCSNSIWGGYTFYDVEEVKE